MNDYRLGLLHGALLTLIPLLLLGAWMWVAAECAEVEELARYTQPPEPIEE